ncbi:MAG: OmpH family outer membrane protein [Candidatus Jordarchaeum sp.]|uniref:OmpH family outer membrane protein n=1 Tax=Candidatus Jordarchaeum sp. TaxID=2823881 RepID=UPI004049AF12
MLKRTGAILLILLLLIIGFAALIALNNNTDYPPLTSTTGIKNLKNGEISTSNLTNILVLRNISINNYGIATVTDTFTVRNDDIAPATVLDVFYPENIWLQLITHTAYSGNIQLDTEEIFVEGRNGTRIFFHQSVIPGETYKFTLKQYFEGTLTNVYYDLLKRNVSQFDFLACPYVPHKTEICKVSVTLPKDATAISPTQLNQNFYNIEPFDTSKVLQIKFYFKDAGSLMSFKTVYRQIEVDPWLGIKVTETYLIRNEGPSGLNRIYLKATPGTIDFKAYDLAGSLSAWPSGDSFAINTRFSVPPNGTYYCYAIYRIPIAATQVGSSGSYLFTFNILPDYVASIDNFYVSIIFNNFLYTSFQSPPTIPIASVTQNFFLYAWNNIVPTQKVYFYLVYGVGFPTSYLRPFVFMLIFGAVAVIYTIFKSRRVKPIAVVARPIEISASILREFCDLYEEKSSLILEMDRLHEDASRKKIKKGEYAQRIKAAEKELATFDKQLNQKKTEILKLDKKFESDFNALEINEADREQAKLAIQSLRRRYLMKRLSKETYIKLTEAQEKKLKKAESNIDKKIQDLRREAI